MNVNSFRFLISNSFGQHFKCQYHKVSLFSRYFYSPSPGHISKENKINDIDNLKDHSFFDFNEGISDQEKQTISNDMVVIESFLSVEEERSLLDEVEPFMRRLRYEFNHWDDAIHGFRETERLNWNDANSKIIDRLRTLAFPTECRQIRYVHVLDLAAEGYIKPHVDSTRFCGDIIAGLSLLSDSVMRLIPQGGSISKSVSVLLKRQSLYVMTGAVRYDYTHEVLRNEESLFKGKQVEKKRRISLICRNEPTNPRQ